VGRLEGKVAAVTGAGRGMGRAHGRVLLALPHFPHDPSSGAARTAITICEFLAASGFVIRTLGTTACEASMQIEAERLLSAMGISTRTAKGPPREFLRSPMQSSRPASFSRAGIGRDSGSKARRFRRPSNRMT
jgi:hypothetical protein